MRTPAALLFALCAATAAGYEGEVRRYASDAGVVQPMLTKAPVLENSAPAKYPQEAQARGLTAVVRMLVTIAADGSVSEVRVVEPVGNGFDEAAADAVRLFRFSPGEVDGVPAPVQIEYVYHFTLESRPVEASAPPVAHARLTGQLIARGSRLRVPAALIQCAGGEGAQAVSDREGRFELSVPAGECAVRVTANGFEPFQRTEKLDGGETREVTYYLASKASEYETVVRAERERTEVVRHSLERVELQRIPGSFGDPIRALQNFPGVARVPFVAGQLIVRGATPSETSTQMDGVSIPILYHLGGGPSVVNSEFLDRVDFYPGGFGAKYGRAIGGLVDVATRKGARDTVHGVFKVDPLDASAFLEAPASRGVSIAAAVRRSYVDALLPLFLPKDANGGTLLVVPRYWDYQLRADLGSQLTRGRKPEGHTFYVMAFGSDDSLRVVASGGGRNRDVSLDAHTLFHRVKMDWSYRKGGFASELAPYVGYDSGNGTFGTTSAFQANVSTVGAREDLTFDIARWIKLRAGADALFSHLSGEAELPLIAGTQYRSFPGAQPSAETQSLSRRIDDFDGALYAEGDFKAGRLTVTPGARATRARIHGRELRTFDPRLWVRYQLLERTQLKGSAGMYSQAPNATDFENPPLGNPLLRFQKAFQTSAGVEQRFASHWFADAVAYYHRRYDMAVSPGRITANPDGSVTRERFSNDGLGRAYGLEFLVRHDVTRNFSGWLAYTLNRSLVRRAGGDDYRLSAFDETHILAVVATWRPGAHWELGGRFRYVTGRPITSTAHPYDAYSADTNRFYSTAGDELSSRLPAFRQLDLRAQKDFLFQSWTLSVYLDVQNVTNARNSEARIFDYRYREALLVPGIPILPLLGVKGSF
jgi:TonB family protein